LLCCGLACVPVPLLLACWNRSVVRLFAAVWPLGPLPLLLACCNRSVVRLCAAVWPLGPLPLLLACWNRSVVGLFAAVWPLGPLPLLLACWNRSVVGLFAAVWPSGPLPLLLACWNRSAVRLFAAVWPVCQLPLLLACVRGQLSGCLLQCGLCAICPCYWPAEQVSCQVVCCSVACVPLAPAAGLRNRSVVWLRAAGRHACRSLLLLTVQCKSVAGLFAAVWLACHMLVLLACGPCQWLFLLWCVTAACTGVACAVQVGC
jgi:hypothetical protein